MVTGGCEYVTLVGLPEARPRQPDHSRDPPFQGAMLEYYAVYYGTQYR